ncbi:hypothetical protein [Novosphingobium sp. FKTRR1]|uniref:hypothetical protein n=1 Tax=Novosphingobium sp. FKTRR1 TaxID=2879118 RepID=UPI001CF0AB8F|nr:hypothetical protein [Novosphingobium sp. FKTRR1]
MTPAIQAIAAQRGGQWGVLLFADQREALFIPAPLVNDVMAQIAQAAVVADGMHPAQAVALSDEAGERRRFDVKQGVVRKPGLLAGPCGVRS